MKFICLHNKMKTFGTFIFLHIMTSLDLSYAKLGSGRIAWIAQAIKTNNSLTSINLSANEIDGIGANALMNALSCNTTLTALDLSRTYMQDWGTIFVAYMLKNNSTLKTLRLRENRIFTGATYIFNALEVNKSLTALDLSYNRFAGMIKSLTTTLAVNKTLTSIALDACDLRDCHIKSIADALDGSSVKTISLGNNKITDTGASFLATALKYVNTRLTHLNLSCTDIGQDGAVDIATALSVNKTLTSLDLSHTNIAPAISPLLIVNSVMSRVFSVAERKIGLADAIRLNSTLKIINLSFCNLGKSEIDSLADALKRNTTLQSMFDDGIRRDKNYAYRAQINVLLKKNIVRVQYLESVLPRMIFSIAFVRANRNSGLKYAGLQELVQKPCMDMISDSKTKDGDSFAEKQSAFSHTRFFDASVRV
jgi:Ran GTPase-activating protein (RanGAP) involved in mRNA processing and transport